MANRETPYGAFNFLVNFGGDNAPDSVLGGFSDVSGIGTEINIAEYRNGNEKENHVRKIPGTHKVSDVTLKRGVVNSEDFWKWIVEVQREGPSKQRDVSISLRDEAGKTVQTWTLRRVVPNKYTAPTLAAKGGGDVAMEELVLAAEAMELEFA
ncbi:MAG: phage tail protein [bacterium]|nr:phage tail protein [bacterium]